MHAIRLKEDHNAYIAYIARADLFTITIGPDTATKLNTREIAEDIATKVDRDFENRGIPYRTEVTSI